MRSRLQFPNAENEFHGPNCEFILKLSSLNCWFRIKMLPIFYGEHNIIFSTNFEVHLKNVNSMI